MLERKGFESARLIFPQFIEKAGAWRNFPLDGWDTPTKHTLIEACADKLPQLTKPSEWRSKARSTNKAAQVVMTWAAFCFRLTEILSGGQFSLGPKRIARRFACVD
jgi:hypothetical protein